jgi:hypothetical protein
MGGLVITLMFTSSYRECGVINTHQHNWLRGRDEDPA